MACEDTRRTGDSAARARHRDADDVLLRAQRALEGRADPRGAAVGPRRRARLRRGHAGHLRPGLPARARRPRRGASRSCRCPGRAPRRPRSRCRACRPIASCSSASCRRKPGARRDALEELAARAADARVLRVPGARRRVALRTWCERSATATPSSAARPPSCTRSTCARPLSALRARLAARDGVKGEIVLVVAGAPEAAPSSEDPVALYRAAGRGGPHAARGRQGGGAAARPAARARSTRSCRRAEPESE